MTNPQDAQVISRRDFLARAAKAGAAIAATGVIGYWLYDRTGPKAQTVTELVSLPDFSLSRVGPKMSIITGAERVRTINRAFAALGGIEQFIKKGDRVLLKVNAAFASPPALCATAHPQLVAEVIRLCYLAGAAAVTVSDNPINDPESCFALTGIGAAVAAAGGTVLLPREGDFAAGTLPGVCWSGPSLRSGSPPSPARHSATAGAIWPFRSGFRRVSMPGRGP